METYNLIVNLFTLLVNLLLTCLLVYIAWDWGLLPEFCYKIFPLNLEDHEEKEVEISYIDKLKKTKMDQNNALLYKAPEDDSVKEKSGMESSLDKTENVWLSKGYDINVEKGTIVCTLPEISLNSLYVALQQINVELLGTRFNLSMTPAKLDFPGLVIEYRSKRFKDYMSQRALNALHLINPPEKNG